MQNFNVIVKDTIQQIDSLEIDITETWKSLVTGQITEAMNSVYYIFGKLDKIIININLLNEILKISIDINSILNIFLELESAMKLPDYVCIADLIEYEVKPTLIMWKSELNVYLV